MYRAVFPRNGFWKKDGRRLTDLGVDAPAPGDDGAWWQIHDLHNQSYHWSLQVTKTNLKKISIKY